MVRLVALLCVTMYLALMIGGQDRGQARLGMSQQPLMPPLAPRATAVAVAPAPTVQDLVPVAAPVLAERAPTEAAPIEPAVSPPDPVSAEAAPVTTPVTTPTFTLSVVEDGKLPTPAPEPTTVLYVAATSVNVRQGPSTGDPVLGRLTRNEAVSLVRDAGDGWVQVRIEGDGIEGFVAARLLTDKAPAP